MKDQFEDIFRNSLENLQDQPDTDLWSKLDRNLDQTDFDSLLKNRIDTMPVAEPAARVWTEIEHALHPVKPVWLRPQFTWLAAASIILALGWFWFFKTQEVQDIPVYADTHINVLPVPPSDKKNPNTNEMIPSGGSVFTESKTLNRPSETRVKTTRPEKQESTIEKSETPAPVTEFALEELITGLIPDSISKIIDLPENNPVSEYNFFAENPEAAESEPEELAAIERPGLETAVNYILKKVLGADGSALSLDRKTKGEKPVWKVIFNSKLISISGTVPAGKNAE